MGQRLCQAVSYHLAGRDVGELDPLSRNFVTDIMMISMCLVRAWNTGLCAKAIEPWLSPFNSIDAPCCSLSQAMPTFLLTAWQQVFDSRIIIWACWSFGSRRPSLVSSNLNHVASFVASVKAMYSASVEDSAAVDCLFEHQLTGPPFSIKM